MKQFFILVIATIAFSCSPKLAPDRGWGHQRWVIVQMKGVPVQQSGGRKDAFLSFEVLEDRFNGNGGCNQINGNYTVDRKQIHFTDINSTKMSCVDIEFENAVIQALNEVDHYEMSGNDLVLKHKKETLLVLRSQ